MLSFNYQPADLPGHRESNWPRRRGWVKLRWPPSTGGLAGSVCRRLRPGLSPPSEACLNVLLLPAHRRLCGLLKLL